LAPRFPGFVCVKKHNDNPEKQAECTILALTTKKIIKIYLRKFIYVKKKVECVYERFCIRSIAYHKTNIDHYE